MPKKFCPLSREDAFQPLQGSRQAPPEGCRPAAQPGKKAAQGGAEEQEVQPRAPRQGQQQVQPHPPPLQLCPAEEQHGEGQDPEQQVPDLLEGPGAAVEAQQAQHIVAQPQGQAGGQGQQEPKPLPRQ